MTDKISIKSFNCDDINIHFLKTLSVKSLSLIISICKYLLYKNIGNREVISKIFNLFISYSNLDIKNPIFYEVIEFPIIVCKPFLESYDNLILRYELLNFNILDFEIKKDFINIKKNGNIIYQFNKIDKYYDDSFYQLEKISNTSKNISLSLLKYKYLNANNIINDIIKSYNLNYVYVGNNSYITDKIEGNLNLLKIKINKPYPELFISITEEIRKQLVNSFILNTNYFFSNMKAENILYKCTDENTISVQHNFDYSRTFTFPPPEYKYNIYYGEKIKFNKEKKEKVLSWNLGLLLLMLIDNGSYINNFLYTNIDLHNSKNIKKAQKKITEIYGPEYSDYLDINSNNRTSIYISLFDLKNNK